MKTPVVLVFLGMLGQGAGSSRVERRCCGCAAKGLQPRWWTNFTGPWSQSGRSFLARPPDATEPMASVQQDESSLGSIPKLVHIPLIFPRGVPELQSKLVSWQSGVLWKRYGWKTVVWGLDNGTKLITDEFPGWLSMWNGYSVEHPGTDADIMRADALGYFVLHHFGGLLLDADVVMCTDPSTLYAGGSMASFPFTSPSNGEVINAALAAPARHPALTYALRTLKDVFETKGRNGQGVLLLTGPRLLANALQQLNLDQDLGFPNFCEGEDYFESYVSSMPASASKGNKTVWLRYGDVRFGHGLTLFSGGSGPIWHLGTNSWSPESSKVEFRRQCDRNSDDVLEWVSRGCTEPALRGVWQRACVGASSQLTEMLPEPRRRELIND